MNTFKNALLVFLIIIVVLGSVLSLSTVEFRKDLGATVTGLLLAFITVTVLMERALDVFLTTWRAERSEEMDEQLTALSQQAAKQDEEHPEQLLKLENLRKEKRQYRAKTRIIAMWSSLCIGIILSGLAGLRTLEHLVTQQSLAQLKDMQLFIFKAFDIFLTGGLIAGGSDGIHKVMEMLRQFFETGTQRLKYSKK